MYRRTNVIYRVVDALFRNRNLVLITLLCVALPVALLLIFKSKGYTATASVSVAQEGVNIRKKMGADIDQNGWKSAAEVHVANLTTLMKDVRQGGFVDEVFRRAALSHPISLAPGSYDKRIETFLGGFSLKTDGDNLFTISLNWEDGEECKKLVKAIQDQYMVEQVQTKQHASESSATFLKKQLTQQEQRVNQASAEREAFRRRHPEIGPDSHAQAMEYIQVLQDRLQRAKSIAANGGEQVATLAPKLSRESKYIESESEPLTSLGESPAQKRLSELQEKRAQLTSGDSPYSSLSDPVRAVDRQIDQARLDVAKERREKQRTGGKKRTINPFYAELSTEVNRTAISARTAKAEIENLTRQIALEQTKLKELPALQNQMEKLDIRVNSEQNNLGKLRDGYNNALQTANLEREQASQTLKAVGEVYSTSLSGPKKRVQLGFVSLILGAVVAALMVALREWADPTIRYETDIEQALDIPVLTGLPETRAVLAPKSVGGSRSLEGKSRRPKALLPSEEI